MDGTGRFHDQRRLTWGSREMFDFYISEGIKEVCFNIEESEAGLVSGSFADGLSWARSTDS